MKIIIVDDNTNFRETLRFYLEEKYKHQVIGEASSGEEFLAMENIHVADIILMDIVMGKLDGIETTKLILKQFSYIKIIAISMHVDRIFQLQLKQTGFLGCVFKTDIFENIQNALLCVEKRNPFFPDNILSNQLTH